MINNIIFLDCTSNFTRCFSANNTKVCFLVKGLTLEKCNCTIVESVIGSNYIKKREEKLIDGISRVISYPKKHNQLISWLFNIIPLYNDLKKLRYKDCNYCIILEAPDFHIYILYIILSRLLQFKVITIAHEWGPTVTVVHWLRKPSVWLYSKTFGYLSDAILPISEYIICKIKHFNRPFLKIPIIADFSNKIESDKQDQDYFLYCVGASYFRVIKTIINAYDKYHDENGENHLILVLSGTNEQILSIKKYITNKQLTSNIQICTHLRYEDLLKLYTNAKALIIPLDPTSEQDQARFSQKISEYLSTSVPIISNNVGEIKYYFTNKKNILLCTYDEEGFKNSFKWIDNHPLEAKNIGLNGYNLGKKEFDYRKFGKLLDHFIKELFTEKSN